MEILNRSSQYTWMGRNVRMHQEGFSEAGACVPPHADPAARVAAHSQGWAPPPSNTGPVCVLLPDALSLGRQSSGPGAPAAVCRHPSCAPRSQAHRRRGSEWVSPRLALMACVLPSRRQGQPGGGRGAAGRQPGPHGGQRPAVCPLPALADPGAPGRLRPQRRAPDAPRPGGCPAGGGHRRLHQLDGRRPAPVTARAGRLRAPSPLHGGRCAFLPLVTRDGRATSGFMNHVGLRWAVSVGSGSVFLIWAP